MTAARRLALPVIVLVVGLIGTLAMTILLTRAEDGRQQARFEGLTIGAVAAIESRMLAQLTLLRGAAGFFNASDAVTREDFRAYVSRLRLERNYPGVLGIGYSAYAKDQAALARLIAEAGQNGASWTSAFPDGQRRDYSAILYLEPMNRRNKQALGFDMLSEVTRRMAMEEARRSGSARMSGRVRLVQEIDPVKQPGFLIYTPLYRQRDSATQDPLPSSFYGWVYSPLRAHDLFSAIFSEHDLSDIVIEVYDRSVGEQNLLYRSDQPQEQPREVIARSLEVAGRPWVVRVSSSPQFEAGSPLLLGTITGIAGALITFLIGAITLLQARAAELTERQVQLRTTELRHANERLLAEADARQQAEAQVAQMQKMEAIGQLTGGIAHDFNNMLTVIIGNLDMAERRLEDRVRLTRAVGNAKEGAVKAAELTQRLLAFGRRQALSPKVLNANTLLTDMAEMLRRSLGEAVRLQTVLTDDIWRIHADPVQLENAILNIAINARDAMPEGGALTLETSNCHVDGACAARQDHLQPGQYVLLALSDTGHGMPEEVIAKAFEPFFTTKEVGRGTGLGLSQVYGFVNQSAGHLSISSKLGEGTSVKIYLPRYLGDADVTNPKTSETDNPPAAAAEEVILVVEDDDQVRELSVETLRELGYTVLSASGGAQALSLLDQQTRVDLLFTDVVMPGMNGRQLADAARARRPHLKLLFATGYARDAIVRQGRLGDGASLLQKPFTASQLANKVREELER